eukprot:TRINITY_DN15282_c0_g1_i1.p1 TRINITY_DN15282_c0_g1~~TRINITY_DN15282_c0_g1_i1.p1  ORF type:complete len:156 (+),score=47.88 TRINITY_DN15282_c0_g1_i1:69-536(+)
MSLEELNNRFDTMMETRFSSLKSITVDKVNEEKDNTIIVDCRSERERGVSKILNSMDKSEFEEFVGNEDNKNDIINNNKNIVYHCLFGGRGGSYCLQSQNTHKDLVNNMYVLKGSIISWINNGFEIVDSDNNPTKNVVIFSDFVKYAPEGYNITN